MVYFNSYSSFVGAFVIPYVCILILVGKPGYFLEMIMGQFSSRGTIKVFDCVPAMRGKKLCKNLKYINSYQKTFYGFRCWRSSNVCDCLHLDLLQLHNGFNFEVFLLFVQLSFAMECLRSKMDRTLLSEWRS
jgi:hypothetical protein